MTATRNPIAQLAAHFARRAAAFVFAAVAGTAFAGPPAGTIISNTATGTATSGASTLNATSNTVALTTSAGSTAGFAATLVQSATRQGSAGGTVEFPHTLTNTGSLADTYNLAAVDQNLGFSFATIALLPDVNGDGVADNNTPVANPVALAPGQAFRFVVRVTVPASAPATMQGEARLTATSAGGASIAPNLDRVTLFDPNFRPDCGTASKFISGDRGPSPGGPLTITLTYDACDKARSKVMLTDALPAGMRYIAGSARWSGAPGVALTDAAGDTQGTVPQTIAFDYNATSRTLTFSIDNLPVGGLGNVTFQVEIVPGLAINAVVENTAGYAFYDASGNRGSTLTTNRVTYTVTGTADLELVGQRLPTATPGTTVVFTNVLTNRGNTTDTFDITLSDSTFPPGTIFTLFRPDGVTPLADTDGNGTPDTGPVAPNASFNILVRAQIPSTAAPAAYKVTKTARSARAPMRFATADDAVDTLATRCQMALDPDNQALSGFGSHVTYTHFLTNRGNCSESVTAMLAYKTDSRPGWTSQVYLDNPVAGGASVPGALDPTDTPVVQGWTMTLAPGQGVRLLVDVLAPTQAEMQAAQSGAKAIVDTNVTTVTLNSSVTGALTVRDTTALDDNKADGPDTINTIRNHTDNTYNVPTLWAVIGRNAWLRANAPACNAVADVVEQRTVVITGPTGEREEAIATETGPNTGIFTVPSMPIRTPPVVAGNRSLEGRVNDVLEIEMLGCPQRVSGLMTVIEPVSVVFDSRTNEAVRGATVTLLRATGGACTTTRAGEPVTTGTDGRFSFTSVADGDYCLSVAPPNGYAFPSSVPFSVLVAGRNLDVTGPTRGGSYGSPFRVTGGAVVVDVPVDPASQDGLFVQKQASRAIAEVGEFVDYTVSVRNATGNTLDRASVILNDDLPAGFGYVKGTARRDKGTVVADPAVNASRLTLPIGTMRPGEQVVITYRVRLGPGSLQGDGVNRVQASYVAGGISTTSNVASAKVRVVGGVFSDNAFILGKVYLDCNANGVQDKGEPGVPGVRLFLEDGTNVTTDGEGKYSFYGIPNRTHVLKADKTTLPAGTKALAISARNLGDGYSRIVDLKSGELHRGDFALGGCGDAVKAEIAARAKALAEMPDEMAVLSGTQLSTEARVLSDVRALPASGTVSVGQPAGAIAAPGPGALNTLGTTMTAMPSNTIGAPFAQVAPQPLTERPTPAPKLGVPEAVPAVPLEELVPAMDNQLGFVGLKDGDVMPISQMTIRVKGTAGSTFRLTVNGQVIPDSRVGKRASLADKQVQAWEYVGVELKAGDNELAVAQVDSFGNPRGTATIKVKVPGKAAKLVLELPADALADGRKAAKVVVKLQDEAGVPVTTRTAVTLVASRGIWSMADPDPSTPGLQAFVEGGVAEFGLVAPTEPGASVIVVTAGNLKAEGRLDFLPELRNMVAAGVLEGVINMRNIGSKAIQPARSADGFEQELRQLSKEWDDGKNSAAARAAFYLKGKVKGDILLTAAYDSDKDTRERLFRDIQPDEFYPVYGDSAQRGYDAQSTSKLYVRLDKNRSYLLWGDYTTSNDTPARRLSNYSRSLTGLKHHFETDRVSANVFASRDSNRQVIEELKANGTSGPYELGSKGALINSEKVELIVRDRNQPSLILTVLPQARFADYEIDALTGRILFKGPVASVDRDLNPVFIRVTYEVDQGGEQFWVAGGDVQVKVTDRIEVGATYVKDKNPQDPFQLAGANLTVKLSENTFVTAEAARTERGLEDRKGDAGRVEIKHESARLKANAYVAKSDAEFDNPGSYLAQGRGEAGGKLEYRLTERTAVRVEALRSEDVKTGAVRDGVLAGIQHQFAEKMTLEVGIRHATEKGTQGFNSPVPQVDGAPAPAPLPDEVTTVRARVTAPVPGVANATVYGEVEVDVKDADRKIVALGGEYTMANKGRVYARHEFISSITGPYGLNANERQNTTAIGVDTEYMKDGRLFSEYRIRDAIAGGDVEAAVGLKNLWTLAPGLRLGTTFERVHALAGTGQNENTALALALEYTANPGWKGSTRLELRDGATQQSALHTVGFAAKIAKDWTALVRNAYSLTRNKENDGEKTIERMQAGVAYRDSETNKVNVLARVEARVEDDDTQQGVALKSSAQIVSIHADWQPVRPFVLTGRYAAKWANDKSNGLSTKYRAQVVGARATWEFAPKWDVGLVTSAMFGDSTATRQYGVGLELGYLVATNLWVSAGYNFFGYRDADLAGADYTAKGPFVRLRYKFDETLLESVPGVGASRASAAPEGKAP